jgi:large subunit ribosomal protein L12
MGEEMNMKVDPYLHAVLVLHGAGKEISKENLMAVLNSAGVQADEAKAKVLAEAVKGVNFEELLKQAATPVAVAAAPAAAPAEKKEEKKKEEEGKKEEAAAEGLASLFG